MGRGCYLINSVRGLKPILFSLVQGGNMTSPQYDRDPLQNRNAAAGPFCCLKWKYNERLFNVIIFPDIWVYSRPCFQYFKIESHVRTPPTYRVGIGGSPRPLPPASICARSCCSLCLLERSPHRRHSAFSSQTNPSPNLKRRRVGRFLVIPENRK